MNKEQILNQGEQVSGMEQKGEFIYFVARGIIIEKAGKLNDVFVPSLKFLRGQIVGMQNLLPGSQKYPQLSNIYCSPSVMGSVTKLDVTHLRSIIAKDKNKLMKLWEQLCWRLIILNHKKLKIFKGLT